MIRELERLLLRGYEAYHDLKDLGPSIMKFAVMDTQLCMIEEPYVRGTKKIGRNAPCPCGSGESLSIVA